MNTKLHIAGMKLLAFMNLQPDYRRAARYLLRAQVSFSWTENAGSSIRGEGITRDVGLLGAYVFSKTCPPVQSTLRLSIYFPTQPTTIRPLRVHSIARVVRRELGPKSGVFGFAVVGRFALVKSLRRGVPRPPSR